MRLEVQAQAFISDGDDDFWAEGEAARIEVERTDENEVRLGVILRQSESDDATVYVTLSEASRLTHMIGLAVLSPVNVTTTSDFKGAT